MTKKDKLFDFIESRGSVRYTDMVKFMVELNYPGSKYDWRTDRGYYACALTCWGGTDYMYNSDKNGRYLEKDWLTGLYSVMTFPM